MNEQRIRILRRKETARTSDLTRTFKNDEKNDNTEFSNGFWVKVGVRLCTDLAKNLVLANSLLPEITLITVVGTVQDYSVPSRDSKLSQ